MANGGTGAGGGGGGGGMGRDLAIATGLGLVSSLSPSTALGVRTGLGAFSAFDQRRRTRKLSDILAKHYGTDAGGEAETPSNAGDPAFGGNTPTHTLSLDKELGRAPGEELGVGSMTTGAGPTSFSTGMAETPNPNKFSELLKIGAKARDPKHRDELISQLASSGAMDPSALISMKFRQDAANRSEDRYQSSAERSERYHADAMGARARSDERANEQLNLSRRADARAEASAGRADVAAERAASKAIADEARSQRSEARSIQAAELAHQKFELTKEKYEQGQELDADELGDMIKDANEIIEDLKWSMEGSDASDGDKEAIQGKLEALTEQRDGMLPLYQKLLESRVNPQVGGPPMASSHSPARATAEDPNRVVFGRDWQ